MCIYIHIYLFIYITARGRCRAMRYELCTTCRTLRLSLSKCLPPLYLYSSLSSPRISSPLFDTQMWSLTGRRRRQAWTSPLGGATSSVQFIRQTTASPVLFPTDLTHIRHLSQNLRPTPWLSTSTSASTSTSTITSGTRAVAGGPSVLSLHPPRSPTAISKARLHTRQRGRETTPHVLDSRTCGVVASRRRGVMASRTAGRMGSTRRGLMPSTPRRVEPIGAGVRGLMPSKTCLVVA